MNDVIIIGKGAAGLSCALYTSRAGLKTLVIGKKPMWAAQHQFDNYLGFEKGVKGDKLYSRSIKQAERFNAMIIDREVIDVEVCEEGYCVKTSSDKYLTKTILLAVGTNIKNANIKGEKEFEGKGVHYCVPCDGYAYKNKKVIILGNKDFAANEALDMLSYTKNINIYTNGIKDEFSADIKKKLEKNNIKTINEKVIEIRGNKFVEEIVLKGNNAEKIDGIFIAIGHASAIDLALRLGLNINYELIRVDNDQKTNIKGIFAAGDCCNKYKQIGVAVGEGVKAAFSIIKFLNEKK